MTIYHIFKRLLTLQERRKMLVLVLLVFIGMTLEVAGIGLVIPAIAVMTRSDLINQSTVLHSLFTLFGSPSATQMIVAGMLSLVIFYFIKTLFLVYVGWKQNQFITTIHVSLSDRLFAGYLHQPWTFHLQRNSAELIFNITNEVYIFISTAVQPVLLLLTEGLVLLGIVALLFAVEPLGTLIVAATLGVVAWIFQRIVRKHLQRWGVERQYHAGQCVQHLQQGLGGAKEVKLLGREKLFIEQYNKHNVLSTAVNQKQKTLMELPRLWLELFAVVGLAVLVLMILMQGKSLDLILPTLSVFAAGAFRLLPSVNRLIGAIQGLRYGWPVMTKIDQEIQLVTKPAGSDNYEPLSFKQDISIDAVSYRYDGAEIDALQHVSIHIPCGTSVGIIGTSGAGKSTLVDIILGLLSPTSGQVSVDDMNIQTTLRGWQDQVGYVPQTIYLTDDSLRCNVAFGLPEDLIDDAAVLKAIKAAQLEEFVESLPLGMNTLVGERGIRLSGGQRQRIGIARALYHDPAVLVLDEATSALDGATEKNVMESINALHGQKTLLIVAHRLSTVAHCDQLYKLERGRLVDAGDFASVTSMDRVV